MSESISDPGKRRQIETRIHTPREVHLNRAARRRWPFALILATWIAITVAGFGIPGLGPFTNQLIANPQTDSLEFDYVPVGAVPEWTHEPQPVEPSSSRLVIASDYRHYEREANDELWSNAIAAVASKLDEKIARGAGELVSVNRELIKRKLLVPGRSHTQVYQTPLSVSMEPLDEESGDHGKFLEWHRCFIELNFNNEFHAWAAMEYERKIVESRVWQTALMVLSGLGLLVILFGFLHLNHRTQGVYTGRLQSLAMVAAIAIILAALALSNSIEWL